MNYEAKVADLSGTSEVLIDEVEAEARQTRRRRILIAVAVVGALIRLVVA